MKVVKPMDLLDILRFAQNALKTAIKSPCVRFVEKKPLRAIFTHKSLTRAFLTALRAISTSSTG